MFNALSHDFVRPAVGVRREQIEELLVALGWILVCWVVIFWRLGYPSFWDPDEAHYAETTREMLAAREWIVPLYNGQPFFDKPVLFHTLQMVTFTLFGANEFAARLVPAASALGLFAVTAWFGRMLFNREVGRLGALMLATLPATFALSSYAILDMTFTLFLFGGSAMVVVAALTNRTRLQYPGYVLLAAAILTKGPVACLLIAAALLIALAISPDARRGLARLNWARGVAIVAALSLPWFIYMWRSFGDSFVEGYVLQENLRLYARRLYRGQPSYFFYARVVISGLLPWTPLFIGRLIDARREPMDTAERLLWAWTIGIVGFFSLSQFKLDHYIYPAAPALCLLCAKAWVSGQHDQKVRWGISGAVLTIGAILIAAGVVLVPGLDRAPLELSKWVRLIPVALGAAGLLVIIQMFSRGWRPPQSPVLPVAGLLASYVVVIVVGLPSFERVKPVRVLATNVARIAKPDDHIGMYRMNRWSSSWRFYVERPTDALETPDAMRQFLSTPGRHYAAMQRSDFEALTSQGLPLKIVYERPGLFTTTGRGLRSGRGRSRTRFVVVTDADVRR